MKAEDHYKQGLDLKSKGQTDVALTCFRRAALEDPHHFGAQMEVGFMCREKAKSDSLFLRYSFEAFRKAVRIDPTSEDAHNQYIMATQKMGRMDEIVTEYSDLLKQFPENELFKKCHKNVVALSMVMMPQNVNVGGTNTASLRKLFLFLGIGGFLLGLAFVVGAPILARNGKIPKEKIGSVVKIGLTFMVLGMGSFVGRAKL